MPPLLTSDPTLYRASTFGQVHLWDAQTDQVILVSVSLDGISPGAGVSYAPRLSPDCRFVTFLSNATNLLADVAKGTFQVYQRDLATGLTTLVSRNRDGGVPDVDCSNVSVSGDGQVVAFDGLADDLVDDDRNGACDVFVRRLGDGVTELISVVHPDLSSSTPSGLSLLSPGAVSADGRYAAFTSLASQLVPDDGNGTSDVFLCDLWNGTNVLVSVNTNGVGGNGASLEATLSADGRFVAFFSQATDLVEGVTNSRGNVFLRDVWSNTTVLVSANLAGQGANGASRHPVISADGCRVAYESAATDLAPDHTDGYVDIFVYDRLAGTNALVSTRTNAPFASADVARPLISDEGRFVIFAGHSLLKSLFARDLMLEETTTVYFGTSSMPGRVGPSRQVLSRDGRFLAFTGGTNVYLADLVGRTNWLVCSGGAHARISGDGRFLAFEKPLSNPLIPSQPTNTAVVVWDVQHQAEVLASANVENTATGQQPARGPVLSADGRFVFFTSRAADLSPKATNQVVDVFARDLLLGQTWLLSQHRDAATPDLGISANLVLSADGRTLLFQSFASNITDSDFNLTSDLFALRLNVEDVDLDGMDDDWEIACFDSLGRDGTEDFDQDGLSDLAEFKAGSHPANDNSVLRVLSVASLTEGYTTVFWSATPGRSYQVQARNALGGGGWTTLPGTVLAAATHASATEETPEGSAHRYYRVRVLAP